MRRNTRNKIAFVLFSLGFGAPTLAKTVVVPPLMARSTSAETVLSMTTLLASELEFIGDFDEITQLERRPSGWGWSCVRSTSCMGSIARSNSAQALVSGTVSKVSGNYNISLVYYDGGRIVRTEKSTIPTDALAVADGLSSLVRAVITGVSSEDKAKEERVEGFEGGAMGILDAEEEEGDAFVFAAAPPGSRQLTTPTGGADYDEELDELDEEEDEERGGYGGAAAAGAGGAAAGAAIGYGAASAGRGASAGATSGGYGGGASGASAGRAAGASAGAETFDPNAIQFGSAADDISVEAIEFGSATSMIQVEAGNYDEDPIADSPPVYDDLDDPQQRQGQARKRQPRQRQAPRKRNNIGNNSNAGEFSVAGRLGFAKFQTLNFFTYGLEGAYQIQDVLAVVAGIEPHSTRRLLDPATVDEDELAVEWNTILPFNIGAMYKPTFDSWRPYAGGGLQFIPGYVKSTGGMAIGLRVRGGVEYLINDFIALNANLALGMWTGKEFDKVQEGLKKAGFVPQFSVGTVFLF